MPMSNSRLNDWPLFVHWRVAFVISNCSKTAAPHQNVCKPSFARFSWLSLVAFPRPCSSRGEVEQQLRALAFTPAVHAWIMSSLKANAHGTAFSFDLDGAMI